jgi:hypothetical protein
MLLKKPIVSCVYIVTKTKNTQQAINRIYRRQAINKELFIHELTETLRFMAYIGVM